MKTKLKPKKALVVVPENTIQTDEEFIKQFKGKSYQDIIGVLDNTKRGIWFNTYNYLCGCRYLELTGKFKDGGFKTFKDFLSQKTFLSLSKYYSYLKVAYRFPEKLIEKITFDHLAWLIRRKISGDGLQTIIRKIEQDVQIRGESLSPHELKVLTKEIEVPKVEQSKSSIEKILRIQLQEERKRRLEAEKKLSNAKKKILELETALEEEKHYREEIQKGRRGI